MAVIEYGPKNPHPENYNGLRIVVYKLDGACFQKYFNFRGLSATERQAVREQAERIDKRERLDQANRLLYLLMHQPSRSPLSCVLGISVSVFIRRNKNGTGIESRISINVLNMSPIVERRANKINPRYVATFSISLSLFHYDWFVEHWRKACRARAQVIGLKRTPSRWYKEIATEKQVMAFIRKQKKCKQKKLNAR